MRGTHTKLSKNPQQFLQPMILLPLPELYKAVSLMLLCVSHKRSTTEKLLGLLEEVHRTAVSAAYPWSDDLHQLCRQTNLYGQHYCGVQNIKRTSGRCFQACFHPFILARWSYSPSNLCISSKRKSIPD